MASQGDPTRVRGTAPPPPPPSAAAAGSGIELTTLFLSAVASAAAAYITSRIWAAGTLFSAAVSPVIVALVKEGLRRPTEKVVEVVPAALPARSRWTRTGADAPGLVPEDPPPPAPEPVDPAAPHVVLPPVVAADHGPVNVYSTRSRRLRWRLAVITGLLGFAVCVVLFTVPELIAGQSIGRSSSDATTIFGGSSRHHSTKTTTSTTGTTSTGKSTQTSPSTTTTTPQTATEPSTATPAAPSSTAPSTPAPASSATPGDAGQQATPTP